MHIDRLYKISLLRTRAHDVCTGHRRTQDFTTERVHVVGRQAKDGSPPVGSRDKAPVGGLKDEVPQKLKQNVKLAYNFYRFPV